MIYIPFLSIIVLFFVFALLITPIVKKTFDFKICAICAASSSTWISLFIIKRFEIFDVDPLILAVMMGGSVVGVMYSLEEYFNRKNIKKFWIVRLAEICIGFYTAYALAKYDIFMIKISLGLIIILIILIVLLSSMSENKKKNKKKLQEDKKDDGLSQKDREEAIKKLEKSLEDCC